MDQSEMTGALSRRFWKVRQWLRFETTED